MRTMRLVAVNRRFTRISHHIATVCVALCAAGLAIVTAYSVLHFNMTADTWELLRWYAAAWLVFVLALVGLWFVPLRAAVLLIIAGSIALGVVSLLQPPRTSSDAARYVWDGIVQHSGTSPYEYAPADPALKSLHTDWLFPAPRTRADGSNPECPGWEPHPVWQGHTLLCTAINRPEVTTIYPGAAEGYFAAVAFLTPDSAQYLPMQIMGLLLVTGVTVLLLWALRRNGLNPRWAALWAWCPLVASEAVNNAHVDALGALLALVAVLLIAGRRQFSGGVALGLAIAVKLLPAVLLPALIRRRPFRLLVGVLGAFAAAYLPYVVVSGSKVIGYLPGYLHEEGYRDDQGSRFALLRLIIPQDWAQIAGLAVLAVTALLVLWRVNSDRPWTAAAAMFGVALLAATPAYSWYALLLIPLAALARRPEWLAVAAASAGVYLSGLLTVDVSGWGSSLVVTQLSYGAAALLVGVGAAVRLWLGRAATPSRVTALEMPEVRETVLPQERERVCGTDAVLAVQHGGLLSAKRRNQLGYTLLGMSVLAVGVLALRRRHLRRRRLCR